MSNIEKFLKKIGLNSDAISQLNADDSDVESIAAAFKNSQREVLKNDPEFIKPIQDEITGTERSKMEHKIKKQFGLTADEIKDKKFDEIISTAFDKASKATAAGADELQKKLIELTNENKKLVDEIIPAKEIEAKNTIKQFKRDSIISAAIAKRSLIVSSEVVRPAVQSFLDSNYNLDLDDSGNLLVKTKKNLNPLNADGTKMITFDEILDGHLSTLGVVKQSNGSPNGRQNIPNGSGNGNPNPNPGEPAKFNLPGLQKAQANEKNLANMKVFGAE